MIFWFTLLCAGCSVELSARKRAGADRAKEEDTKHAGRHRACTFTYFDRISEFNGAVA
jgi:hypothetical protein